MTKEITLKDVTSSKVTVGNNIDFPAIGPVSGMTEFKKQLSRIRNIDARTLVSSSDGATMLVSITPKKGKKLLICKRIVTLSRQNDVRIPAWINAWAYHLESNKARPVKYRRAANGTRKAVKPVRRIVRRKVEPLSFGQRVKKAVRILFNI